MHLQVDYFLFHSNPDVKVVRVWWFQEMDNDSILVEHIYNDAAPSSHTVVLGLRWKKLSRKGKVNQSKV